MVTGIAVVVTGIVVMVAEVAKMVVAGNTAIKKVIIPEPIVRVGNQEIVVGTVAVVEIQAIELDKVHYDTAASQGVDRVIDLVSNMRYFIIVVHGWVVCKIVADHIIGSFLETLAKKEFTYQGMNNLYSSDFMCLLARKVLILSIFIDFIAQNIMYLSCRFSSVGRALHQ